METILYFFLTLGVLVFVHELGHFLAAKLCRMRVDRFSIGFPPRAFGKVIGETDYCVSWIPIGGYVKIAGMVDESFDTEHLNRPPEPWEFRSKPIWQRMFVISAGVIMNILLAIAIFWGINFTNGRTVRETTEVGYVDEGSPAARVGFRAGDVILRMNDEPVTNWDEILTVIYLESMGEDISVTMLRDGVETGVVIARGSVPEPTDTAFGLTPTSTSVRIDQVEPGKPAAELGLEAGDILMSIDGTPIKSNRQVITLIDSRRNTPVNAEWQRGSEVLAGVVTPNEEGKIGVSIAEVYAGPQTTLSYSVFEAFPIALQQFASVTRGFVQQVWLMIVGESSFTKNVGGPIKIAQMATQSAELGVTAYLAFMAILSISLAILNMLPIPALDGGHFLFLVIEGLIRREIPVRIKLFVQQAGFALLLAFMAFVIYNDISNF
jgi:regulator of sigma E protease